MTIPYAKRRRSPTPLDAVLPVKSEFTWAEAKRIKRAQYESMERLRAMRHPVNELAVETMNEGGQGG